MDFYISEEWHNRKEGRTMDTATAAVLIKSEDLPEGTPQVAKSLNAAWISPLLTLPPPLLHCKVRGYDFNIGVDFDKLMQSYAYTGFQATSVGLAIDEINRMVSPSPLIMNLKNQYLTDKPGICLFYDNHRGNGD